MTIMKENFDLEENQGMITSIDGLAQDEKLAIIGHIRSMMK